jgi:pimeloyl-ACP methyl ester carboxylesterase
MPNRALNLVGTERCIPDRTAAISDEATSAHQKTSDVKSVLKLALGFSWGGAPAQQSAFQNPGRCRRLILAATGTGALVVPATPK